MQLLADLVPALVAMAPVAQEFYLFCFFCLGFFLFRTEFVKQHLQRSAAPARKLKLQTSSEEPRRRYSSEQLKSDFAKRNYQQVLEGWHMLEKQTTEALTMVVTALMMLGRADEVGLFMAKAAANLPQLRQTLYETIAAVAQPSCEVPRQRAVTALRDIFAQARDSLDGRATEVLIVSFTRLNDEPRVSALLQGLASKGAAAGAEVLAKVAHGFLACKNLDATLGYLPRALSAMPLQAEVTAALRETVVGASRLAAEDDILSGDESDDAQQRPRPRTWDMLQFLEGAKAVVSPEAFVPLLEWAARAEPREVQFAAQAEHVLRTLVARPSTPGAAHLPLGAYDALVRVHASMTGDQGKAFACFDELVQSVDNSRYPTEGSLVGMISSCVSARNADLAVHILSWCGRQRRCSLPVFSSTLKVLAAAKQPERVCAVYEEAAAAGLEPDDTVYGQLIKFAVQAGKLDLARELFSRAGNPDAQNYMSLIRACGQEGNVPKALDMLWELRDRGEVDTSCYNSALDVCVSCGDSASTASVFDAMKADGLLDVVSYNILLKQFIGVNRSFEAVDALLKEMHAAGFEPNAATYNALLGDALQVGDFDQAWHIVDVMETTGPGIDFYTISILFKGYKGKRHSMDAASFDRTLGLIQTYSVKVDEVLVNVALEACVSLRDPHRLSATLATFKQCGWTLPKQCAMHTYATLIKAYGQTRQLDHAWKLWSEVTERKGLTPSEQLYGQMIDVLVTNNRLDDALQLFEEMKDVHGEHLDSQGFAVAYAMIIKGYAQQKECTKALQCYDQMKEHGTRLGLVVFNSLIDACSRVGDMDAAARLFRDMLSADCMPDLITYSTLVKGYCLRGELDQAMELFSLMRKKGIKPDAIVFNSLLDGCAKKQMPTLCEQVISDMEDAGVSPSNYSASILIKLYGRCKDLVAAFKVLDEMPRKYGFRPNTAVYTCLMSSCIANNRLDQAMELRLRMVKEGVHLDEKTYSTLLRGALRTNSVERCLTLINAALQQGGRRLLDEELVQGAVALLQRRRGAWDEHGPELLSRLRQAGVSVRCPPGQQSPQDYQYGRRWSGDHHGGGDGRLQRRRGPAPRE